MFECFDPCVRDKPTASCCRYLTKFYSSLLKKNQELFLTATDDKGNTLLHRMIINRDFAFCHYITQHLPAKKIFDLVSPQNNEGRSPLQEAAGAGESEIVMELLAKQTPKSKYLLCRLQTESGGTILHRLAEFQKFGDLAELLGNAKHPEKLLSLQEKKTLRTPLHYVAENEEYFYHNHLLTKLPRRISAELLHMKDSNGQSVEDYLAANEALKEALV